MARRQLQKIKKFQRDPFLHEKIDAIVAIARESLGPPENYKKRPTAIIGIVQSTVNKLVDKDIVGNVYIRFHLRSPIVQAGQVVRPLSWSADAAYRLKSHVDGRYKTDVVAGELPEIAKNALEFMQKEGVTEKEVVAVAGDAKKITKRHVDKAIAAREGEQAAIRERAADEIEKTLDKAEKVEANTETEDDGLSLG